MNPNNGKPINRPTINGRRMEDDRNPRSPQGPGHQLGGAGIVSGPQQAAEQREVINSIEAQRRREERIERERIERERKQRDEAERSEARRRNVEKLILHNAQQKQARQKQVRDAWDSSVLPKVARVDKLQSPSRSRSHQPPPPGTPSENVARTEPEKLKRSQIKRNERRANNFTTAINVDDDAELQRALQASLGDAQGSHAVHDVSDSPIFEDEDEELQRALMMSAAEAQKPPSTSSTSTTAPSTSSTTTPKPTQTTTRTTARTSTTSTSTTSTSSRTAPPVVTADDDVDMDLSEDPELQDALIQSLGDGPEAQSTSVPDKASERRARILGGEPQVKSEKGRTLVHSVADDDDEGDYVNDDPELRNALRMSRAVIDVDKEQQASTQYGGQVEDYKPASSTSTGPIITNIDEDEEGRMRIGDEEEDEELQRALMSSLNPNPSPPMPQQQQSNRYPSLSHNAFSPALAAAMNRVQQQQQQQQQSQIVDPGVAHARRIRTEQDWAYQQSLAEDREKERKANEEREQARIKKEQEEQAAKQQEMEEQARRDLRDKAATLLPPEPADGITLGIRMPNGTRFMRKFSPSDKLQDLRNFIESKANESNLAPRYEITSDFPKRSFHDLSPEATLSDSGISGRMLLNILEKA